MDEREPRGGGAASGLVLLLVLGVLAACGGTSRRVIRPKQDLVHPYSGVRMRAVGEALKAGGTEHVEALIELLDDDDPGVRLAAGDALTELTGHDTGYEPWAGPAERRRQVEAWRAWWAAR